MSVSNGDITMLQSTSAGSSGGAISGSGVTSGVKNNIFPDVTDTERIAGGSRYRKVFWKNTNGTDAMVKPTPYALVLPANATLSYGIGYDNSADDDSAQGNMTAWGANAKVALVSDGADTRNVTIIGLDNSGSPVPVSEVVALTGASEVLSVNTYSKVWTVRPASTSGTRTISVKQGSGGTVRGTIPPNKIVCWLWVATPGITKASGIRLVDLPAGQNIGLWMRLTWIAGATQTKPNGTTAQIEES